MEESVSTYLQVRRHAGLTCAEAAHRLGLDADELSMYENASGIPDAAVVMRMARLYGVSADYLIGNTGTLSALRHNAHQQGAESSTTPHGSPGSRKA